MIRWPLVVILLGLLGASITLAGCDKTPRPKTIAVANTQQADFESKPGPSFAGVSQFRAHAQFHAHCSINHTGV